MAVTSNASPWRALSALGLTLVACTAAPPQPPPATPDPTAAAVVAAREALGEPLVALAEAAQVLATDLETIRHDLPRGRPMRDGFPGAEQDISVLRRAADIARVAAREAPHAEASALVADAADAADAAARSAGNMLEHLDDVAAVDIRLAAAAAVWDEPGSQTERRAQLTALLADLDRIGRRVDALRPVPRGCSGLVSNRVTWLDTVRRRTERLAEHATSAGGERYDELRDAYRRQPLGEDPVAADAGDRACFQQRARAVQVAVALRAAVQRLQQLLG